MAPMRILANGSKGIRFYESGTLGIVLADTGKKCQPYVTWQYTVNEEGKADTYWGHYFDKMEDAINDFHKRVWGASF